MKGLYSLLLFAIIICLSMAMAQDHATICDQHLTLLKKDGVDRLVSLPQQIFQRQDNTYAVVSNAKEASLFTIHQGTTYHIYATRKGQTIFFSLHSKSDTANSTVFVTIEKTESQCTIKIDQSKSSPGISVDTILPVAMASLEHIYCQEEWWTGFLSFSPEEYESRTYYATRDEAVANVPTHVSPKYCFVWRDGTSALPWRPIPGTGCAHWVAHQKGIGSSPGCYDGYAIRVTQVTSGKTAYSLSNANVGDIWTNTDQSHCGIVISVGSNQVKVRHCSSGSGGVVENWFSSGYAWR